MINFKKNPQRLNITFAKSAAAAVLLCAALSGEAMAASSCGKAGQWLGEGLNQEVAFAKRLGATLPSYLLEPTQAWTSRLGDRSTGPLGSSVCAGDAGKLRSGAVTSDFILVRPAANRIETSQIAEECNGKERELEKLPPDKQALLDEKTRQTRQILGGRAPSTPEHRAAMQERDELVSRARDEHRTAIRPQLQALHKECRDRLDPLAKDVRYTIGIQVNPSGLPKNDNETKPLADLGDKAIRSGPNDRVRRVLVFAKGDLAATRAAEDLAILKSFVDLARLQALVDSGQLPSDAELASIKASQQAAMQDYAKWSREQDQLVSQAERVRRDERNAQDTAARRAANPSASPAPAPASTRAQTPASNTGSEQATAPAPAPAPQTPAVPSLPNIQLPGNVGNVLRGVFGR